MSIVFGVIVNCEHSYLMYKPWLLSQIRLPAALATSGVWLGFRSLGSIYGSGSFFLVLEVYGLGLRVTIRVGVLHGFAA